MILFFAPHTHSNEDLWVLDESTTTPAFALEMLGDGDLLAMTERAAAPHAVGAGQEENAGLCCGQGCHTTQGGAIYTDGGTDELKVEVDVIRL